MPCLLCKQDFSEKTLAKWKGYCKKCYDIKPFCLGCSTYFASTNLQDGLCLDCYLPKTSCKMCKKRFKRETLEKEDGYCFRCKKIVVAQAPPASLRNATRLTSSKVAQEVSSAEPQEPSRPPTVPKTRKDIIPKKIRAQVWLRSSGDKFYGKCYCCQMRLSALDFACGHKVSEAKGGKVELDNLEVVCTSCNSRMATQDMEEFIKERFPDRIPKTKDLLSFDTPFTVVSFVSSPLSENGEKEENEEKEN